MTTHPALALLLDVDGPIASPITRTVCAEGLADDLVTLAHAGIPVIFNTGRSDDFIASVVMPALRERGLDLAHPTPDGACPTVFAVCEKGATLYLPGASGTEDVVRVSDNFGLPTEVLRYCEDLAADFTDVMFWDATKRAMASVEAHPGIDMHVYRERQASYDKGVWQWLAETGRPGVWGDESLTGRGEFADATPVRIDTTIISTDVELATTGKDLGADVALAELAARGVEPAAWRTMGDSRGDYAMADRLHELGHEVRHVDVRPADGMMQRPYAVDVADDSASINDVAGAEFVARWRADIRAKGNA